MACGKPYRDEQEKTEKGLSTDTINDRTFGGRHDGSDHGDSGWRWH